MLSPQAVVKSDAAATEAYHYLLHQGSDLPDFARCEDAQGRTALFWAARYNRMVCARGLCSRTAQADLNHRDREGNTPLLIAASNGQ